MMDLSRTPPGKTFNKQVKQKFEHLKRSAEERFEITSDFTVEDICKAITSLKNGKSAGVDSINPE